MEGKRSFVSTVAAGEKSKRLKSSYSTGDQQCLFCWRVCKLEEEDETLVGVEIENYPKMEGAFSSVLLRRNLCHWFIIRKLLDIPIHWCHAKLMTFPAAEEDNEEKNCGGPDSWFKVCEECLNTLVLEAWRVHDLILKLEGRMNDIKAKIKKNMRDNCVRGLEEKTGRESWRKNEHIAMEIRKIVFPEMEELLQHNTVLVKVEEDNDQHSLYPEEEDAILESVIDRKLCPENELSRNFDLIGPHSDDDVNYKDDDPTDCNWTPSTDEDDDDKMSKASVNERDEMGGNTENEIQEIAVKKMRTRGKDKKKRKRKTVQNIRRGPYKKKIEDARKCLRTQRQLKVSKTEVSGGSGGDLTEARSHRPQETKAKRKSGQRGKDKQKRKAKAPPRIRKDRPKIIVYPCELCSCRPFITSEELEVHKNLHELRRLAKINGMDSMTAENLDCEKCSFPAKDRIELDHHIRCRHDIPEAQAQQPKYPCPKCPKKMKNWMDILHHVKVKHSTAKAEEVENFKDRFLKCDECGFRGKLPRHLIFHKRRHQRQAAPPVPVREEDCRTCEECGLIFDNEKKYKIHVANTHRRVNRYVCDICGAGFLFPNKLNAHKENHKEHLKRDWICHVCGLDFAKKQVLQKHSRQIHPDEDDPTLKRTGNLGTATFTGAGERIFSCRYCELTSPYNAVIRKHLQTHKEQGKHECEKCGKLYMNAQGLKRHLRINHNESGERFPCPHCNREFPSQEYRMIHIKRHCKLKELH